MEFRLLLLSGFLYLTLVGSYAFERVDWEPYWHSVLPNAQFPKALRNVLLAATPIKGKNTYVGVGKTALAKVYSHSYPGDKNIAYGHGSPQKATKVYSHGSPQQAKVYSHGSPQKATKVYSHGSPQKATKVYSHGSPQQAKVYSHGFPKVDKDEIIFFLEKDLHVGKKMKLSFPKGESEAKFLPRKVAKTIPFSSNELPAILNRFDIKAESLEAEMVKETIQLCEEPAIEGESKFCATSPESLIDFGASKLGKRVQVYTTEVDKETKLQEYRMEPNGGVTINKIGDRSVVCHKQNYVYAVFYCHEIHATRAFMVSLVGSDGTRVKAVALCHDDTRFWDPQHLAFQLLKVKPGTLPICHFLSRGNLVWVPN